MDKKRKWILRGIGGFTVLVILFIASMTWLYPFSPFSVYKSYTYKPGTVLYNDKTYKNILSDFEKNYKKDLNEDLKRKSTNYTINRTQYILPIFEQDWLIGNDPKVMDKDKLEQMLVDVQQARNTLLNLVTEGDYTSEAKSYLVVNIRNFLSLEERIRQLKDQRYLSRKDLKIMFGNLRNDFRSEFDIYTTTFYDISR